MTFGDWRGILFAKVPPAAYLPVDIRPKRAKLAEFGNFFVEMLESGFQGFPVVGVSGRCQVVDDPRAGKLKPFTLLLPLKLFRGLLSRDRFLLGSFG